MEALASHSENLSKKERRRKDKRFERHDLNDTNIAWPARARGGGQRGRKKVQPIFFLALFRVCSRAIFASKLSVQLIRGTENTCRYVERCGYQQTKNNFCSNMPPTANLRIFIHKPIARSLTWTAYPRR